MPYHAPPFRDRAQAGQVLAGMLAHHAGPGTVVLAVPNGGVAVGVPVAWALGCPLRLLVVRKIQIPGNSEAGFGAVASDGTAIYNQELLARLGLTPAQVEIQKQKALASIRERLALYGDWARPPELGGRTVILVDDGLASGVTMASAAGIVRQQAPARLVVAAPTASASARQRLLPLVDELVCPDVRAGPYFAVAEAYAHWRDLEVDEVLRLLENLPEQPESGPGRA
ncbi:MAG: phosphoribosyltransferase [Desulfarculus sp.]|nr:phosphoribosyltransferase [Desulfarculus sp.]